MTDAVRLPPIRLTELTDCGGCAAKLGADLLADALSGLGAEPAPDELIAGLAPADDAAAYRISDDLAIIGTLDFFPPLVDGARPGDVLLLTKRLGTGLLVSGSRQGRADPANLAVAIDQMRRLNRAASEALVRQAVTGATDVTGFGLLGHGLEMARASGTTLVFDARALPALDGALDVARSGVETGGAAHNRRFVAPALDVAGDVPAEVVAVAHDPQTSGGLLATVPPATLPRLQADLLDSGVEHWIVGRVEARGGGDPGVRLA
jgi:selenide,water dikinase